MTIKKLAFAQMTYRIAITVLYRAQSALTRTDDRFELETKRASAADVDAIYARWGVVSTPLYAQRDRAQHNLEVTKQSLKHAHEHA